MNGKAHVLIARIKFCPLSADFKSFYIIIIIIVESCQQRKKIFIFNKIQCFKSLYNNETVTHSLFIPKVAYLICTWRGFQKAPDYWCDVVWCIPEALRCLQDMNVVIQSANS